jgi:D-alanyl-lipoteichoic acid acyltransferase DltB (MBOAT superfamily)
MFPIPFLLGILFLGVPLYYALPQRRRAAFLLALSFGFYASFVPWHTVLLAGIVLATWGGARWIAAGKGKSPLLIVSLLLCAVLSLWKAYPVLLPLLRRDGAGPTHWIVPLGLSFVLFRAIGYLIDVRRGTVDAERSLPRIALFLSFFPHVMSGPIERYPVFVAALDTESDADAKRLGDAAVSILWGLFLKIVIADRLGYYASDVFEVYPQLAGPPVVLAAYCYAFSLYLDFLGYTVIAGGMARLFGFPTPVNFRQPYLARSIAEFWQRWHVSLSFWFRDYVFLPLSYALQRRVRCLAATRRTKDVAVYATASLATMLLCGLWHGIGWTFVLWGAMHGVLLAGGAALRHGLPKKSRLAVFINRRGRARDVLRRVITFHLVCAAWLVFRSDSLEAALHLFQRIAAPASPISAITASTGVPGMIANIALLAGAVCCDVLQNRASLRPLLYRRPTLLRWGLYLAMFMALLVFGRLVAPIHFLYAGF